MIIRLLPVLLVLATAGCGDSPDRPDDPSGPTADAVASADPAAVAVEIAFHDASVAPEYHRSWTITADEDTLRVVADSYGDVLDDTTLDMPPRVWAAFVDALPAALDKAHPDEPDEGCPGGTGLTLEVSGLGDGVTTIESGSCGGENRAVLEDLVTPLVEVAGEEL